MSEQVEVELADPRSAEAVELVAELDAHLQSLYPPEGNYLDPADELAKPHVRFLIARRGCRALGCGAVKFLDGYAEIKRVYVRPAGRGSGVGRRILDALVEIAAAEGAGRLRLETGPDQPEALALFRRAGFAECERFGDYRDSEMSVFMEKRLV